MSGGQFSCCLFSVEIENFWTFTRMENLGSFVFLENLTKITSSENLLPFFILQKWRNGGSFWIKRQVWLFLSYFQDIMLYPDWIPTLKVLVHSFPFSALSATSKFCMSHPELIYIWTLQDGIIKILLWINYNNSYQPRKTNLFNDLHQFVWLPTSNGIQQHCDFLCISQNSDKS